MTGIVIINDIGGADMNLVKNLNPAFMKKSMTIFQVWLKLKDKEKF